MNTLGITIGRMSRSKFLRKYFGHPYLVLSKWIWGRLPASMISSKVVRSYGRHCQDLVRLQGSRRMSIGTLFLRNRPELGFLLQLLDQKAKGSSLSMAVLACSKGAEVYSISFTIRSARPDLKLTIHAIDISKDILEFAEGGRYSLQSLDGMDWPDASLIARKGDLAWQTWRGQNVSIFERMTPAEMDAMFDRQGNEVRVKARFREGIVWHVGDAGDPELARRLGVQDIVMAKNFLCHMNPHEAEKCLRNISRLVKPDGYLFVSGLDLNVRTRVALELGWNPVTDRIAEIHEGDPSLRTVWPWNYCGLEPLDRHRPDWHIRYASIFRVGETGGQNHS